jgi:hypothetical protein
MQRVFRVPNELRERDMMICRYCGNPERASEGQPCTNCGTFICVLCSFRGVTLCKKCETETGKPQPAPPATGQS